MDVTFSKVLQLLARLEALHQQCGPDEPWFIEQEPHDYADGTTHFTNVVFKGRFANGDELKVMVGRHLTPPLAELLVLMKNNLPHLVRWSLAAADRE